MVVTTGRRRVHRRFGPCSNPAVATATSPDPDRPPRAAGGVLPRSDRRARFAASPARSRYGFAHSSCGASAQSQQRRYGAGCPAAVGRARQRPLRIRVHAGCGWAGTTSATIVVPDVPDLAEAASARLPMTAGRPVLVANRLAASIFGPIDPGGRTAGRHRKLPHAEGVSTISRSSCQPSAELIQEGGAASGNRTPDPRITNALLWPTELRRRAPSKAARRVSVASREGSPRTTRDGRATSRRNPGERLSLKAVNGHSDADR
jgi:hypothetical protein